MVTTEILQSLGYSSMEEYFEHMFNTDDLLVVEIMHEAMSEEQRAEYEDFLTLNYYEYHDNK